ncbi:TPA: Hsp70 family protein [Streptococcus suis]|nr:Hsp70 family protein [Streptococcus suis]HEL2553597.1 Hsp70 family protein [Streptococcus suis]
MKSEVVGIDLGTTYSVVAKLDSETGEVRVLKNSQGSYTTPSIIAFDGEQILFGEEAKEELLFGGEAASFYKRELANEAYHIKLGEKSYNACELSSLFLEYLVKDIEETHGFAIDAAVISVPAYFTHVEVQATMKAANLAGIKVLGVIHEPTAAALAYGIESSNESKTILFYDLGGGTFDVTVIRITGEEFTVLGSSGDSQLGGKDFDQRLKDYFLDEVKYYLDETENNSVIQSVLGIEKIKKRLSEFNEVPVPITIAGKKEEVILFRSEFESLSEDLVDRTVEISESLLNDLHLTWSTIDKIILVGGSVNMPMIRNCFVSKLGRVVENGVNVDEAVAIGAAIRANMLSKEKQNSIIGTKKLQNFIQFTDVTSHGLGMIALNENRDKYINSIIIPKNSTIPVSIRKRYVFKPTNQSSEMEIFVLQGEDSRVAFNTFVNKYIVNGFDPSEFERTVEVTVTYSYNTDGLIEVFAHTDGKKLTVITDNRDRDISWAYELPKDGMNYKQIFIAIDTSGSMVGYPIHEAKAATLQFIDQMGSNVYIGLISVADTASCICPLTRDRERLSRALERLITHSCPDGGGNLGHPFELASELMEEGLLIVLADGIWKHQHNAIEAANRIKYRIDIVGIGFGSADEEFLREISSIEGIGGMTDLENLSKSFSNVAQVISEGSPSLGIKALD